MSKLQVLNIIDLRKKKVEYFQFQKGMLTNCDCHSNEVEHKAIILQTYSCVEALDGVSILGWTVSRELRFALGRAVRQLEDVPDHGKDKKIGTQFRIRKSWISFFL